LPDLIAAGSPKNPLGAAALYLMGVHYAIHGTNNPKSIFDALQGPQVTRPFTATRAYSQAARWVSCPAAWRRHRRSVTIRKSIVPSRLSPDGVNHNTS
jgi:hypothetical protein